MTYGQTFLLVGVSANIPSAGVVLFPVQTTSLSKATTSYRRFPENIPSGMLLRRIKAAATNLVCRLRTQIQPESREEEIDSSKQEAERLNETYGPPWPEKCSPLTTEWYDSLPEWAFRRKDDMPQARQERIDDLKSVHAQRMKRHKRRHKAGQQRRPLKSIIKY